MRSLSVRSRFALCLVALNVVAMGVLALFAYRASRDGLTTQAVATARMVADARSDALTRALEEQQDRLGSFLTSVESLCGERVRRGGNVAFEPECTRIAMRGFRNAEHALAVELYSGSLRVVTTDAWPAAAVQPTGDRLASIGGTSNGAVYSMQATRDRLVVRAAYPLGDLAATFTDRSALKSKGQLLLTDRDGRVIVPLATEAAALQVPPPLVQAMRDCAAYPEGNVLVRGGQGAGEGIIAGVKPVPAIGGGCIVARLDYDEALAPIYRLERLFRIAFATLIAVALVLSLFIARFGEQVQREHEARIGAEAANRSKDEFLATLSHELRTPLTAILGWASILRQYPQNQARVDHALRVIERNARMESRLIDDLLDVTRIVNGQLQLSVTSVSAVAAVEAAVEAIRPAADSKGVLVTSHVEGAVANVQADLQRLQQIVWNLLANAVRFTPEAGWVNVVVRSAEEGTQIVVSDTGAGISPELLPHVFDRFRQGQSGTMRTHGGLGLGLAIVHDLVELHGGAVAAASGGQDRGATLTVTLPAVPATAAAGAATATADSRTADLHGKSVLVVEDDADTREVVREILRQAGATVVTSGSVNETRAVIERFKPDVLISDIGMPDEDGYALMESIRVNEPNGLHLPAIALSAHARPEDVEQALKAGFDVHVSKPVDSLHLLTTVTALLRSAPRRPQLVYNPPSGLDSITRHG